MSDTYLKLVPVDPQYVPPKTVRGAAIKLLAKLFPEGEEFEAEVYDRLTFIDQGENLLFILCPRCGAKLDRLNERIAEWWHQVEDDEAEQGADGFKVNMPCCGERVLFTDLEFDMPGAFARFELNVMNPETRQDLRGEQLAELEALLKCKLKQVWAQY